jgi:hypothetical protein
MPQSRTLYGGTLGASNPTFTTRVTFDPTKQRPFVCVSVPATAPDVQGSIYDDISQSFSAIDHASTDLFPDDYTGPGGVAMKMGCVLQQLQLLLILCFGGCTWRRALRTSSRCADLSYQKKSINIGTTRIRVDVGAPFGVTFTTNFPVTVLVVLYSECGCS